MQAVVEGAEHTHQCGGLLYSEMQVLRRVEDQRRVEDGEAERREDLNEEQRSRSLRSRGEKALERFDEADAHHLRSLPRELDRPCRLIPVGSIHHALLCRSTRRVMSSRAAILAEGGSASPIRDSPWRKTMRKESPKAQIIGGRAAYVIANTLGQRVPPCALVNEKRARFLEYLVEFLCCDFSNRMKNDVLFDAEKSLRTNEAWLTDFAALTIGIIQRNGERIPVNAACDLTQNQIRAWK